MCTCEPAREKIRCRVAEVQVRILTEGSVIFSNWLQPVTSQHNNDGFKIFGLVGKAAAKWARVGSLNPNCPQVGRKCVQGQNQSCNQFMQELSLTLHDLATGCYHHLLLLFTFGSNTLLRFRRNTEHHICGERSLDVHTGVQLRSTPISLLLL